jgi:hypothetical protein
LRISTIRTPKIPKVITLLFKFLELWRNNIKIFYVNV